jgi:hypothetical protein
MCTCSKVRRLAPQSVDGPSSPWQLSRGCSVTNGTRLRAEIFWYGANDRNCKPCNDFEVVIESRAGMRVVLRGYGGSSSRQRSEIGDVIACRRSEDLAAFVDCHSNDSPSSLK